MVYPHTGKLVSNKRDQRTGTHAVDGPPKPHAKGEKPDAEDYSTSCKIPLLGNVRRQIAWGWELEVTTCGHKGSL